MMAIVSSFLTPSEIASIPGMPRRAPWQTASTAESRMTILPMVPRESSMGSTSFLSGASSPSFRRNMASFSWCRVTSPSSSLSGPTLVLRSSTMVAPTPRTSPRS